MTVKNQSYWFMRPKLNFTGPLGFTVFFFKIAVLQHIGLKYSRLNASINIDDPEKLSKSRSFSDFDV